MSRCHLRAGAFVLVHVRGGNGTFEFAFQIFAGKADRNGLPVQSMSKVY